MIAQIYIKGYYSRESYNKSRMYLCHTQNVISVTDKTDEEKWLDTEIWFIFLFQNGDFWFQCLKTKFPATTGTQSRWASVCNIFLSFFTQLLEINKASLVKQNLLVLLSSRGRWKIPWSQNTTIFPCLVMAWTLKQIFLSLALQMRGFVWGSSPAQILQLCIFALHHCEQLTLLPRLLVWTLYS